MALIIGNDEVTVVKIGSDNTKVYVESGMDNIIYPYFFSCLSKHKRKRDRL